jgi:hypothetical protein
MSSLGLLFSTPAIVTTEMTEADVQRELQNMIVRSLATDDLIKGAISPSDFLEVLAATNVDVDDALDGWESDSCFMT